ncbi:hypothetical protein [Solobacterium moorei]|uniref:Glycerophosphoryl diester phosphodiesterase membrane domain-containing protein n=1 Tax=Solobacterium moorei F0204 TaxID=706433 RepID=E7MQ87_9FIRM|nr:hypothetical protein [Solobacterium moorei]EFW23807.1 hypothetical protein HMPREF9430_01612 [Solobacterium moorei F0204]MDI6413722.1 hypothetical protein [Solobacterium moorei]
MSRRDEQRNLRMNQVAYFLMTFAVYIAIYMVFVFLFSIVNGFLSLHPYIKLIIYILFFEADRRIAAFVMRLPIVKSIIRL